MSKGLAAASVTTVIVLAGAVGYCALQEKVVRRDVACVVAGFSSKHVLYDCDGTKGSIFDSVSQAIVANAALDNVTRPLRVRCDLTRGGSISRCKLEAPPKVA